MYCCNILTMLSGKKYNFTTVIEKDENGAFVASVPGVPGCHTQGDTIKEAQKNVMEALELCLEESKSNKWYAQEISFPAKEKRKNVFGVFNLPIKPAFK